MIANGSEDIIDVKVAESRRKVDESYGKVGESYCGEWDYLYVR